jgi:hypothetical protein
MDKKYIIILTNNSLEKSIHLFLFFAWRIGNLTRVKHCNLFSSIFWWRLYCIFRSTAFHQNNVLYDFHFFFKAWQWRKIMYSFFIYNSRLLFKLVFIFFLRWVSIWIWDSFFFFCIGWPFQLFFILPSSLFSYLNKIHNNDDSYYFHLKKN